MNKEAEENHSEVDHFVEKAALMAQKAHDGQKRKSGEPYITHPAAVVKIIEKEFGIKDPVIRASGYLHDCPEDTKLSLEEIERELGPEVANTVDGVTKLEFGTKKDTVKKVILNSYVNVRTALLKVADRLHNLRTLVFTEPAKQAAIATETLDVYTRLAESLGLWIAKTEMEDICYSYLSPQEFQETKKQIDEDQRLTPLFIANVTSRLNQILSENDFEGKVFPRKGGYWALKQKQRKLVQDGKCTPGTFKEINDLVSFRIILDSVENLYSLARVLHQEYGEIVDYKRFDEFIGANKRINGYEAIQTTLNFKAGPVEIALVTKEMEKFNRLGVASRIDNKEENLEEYVLKLVFTPTGSVRYLPKKATGVDFAANLSDELLKDATSMLVDGKDKELSEIIPNASTVEIIFEDSRSAPLPGLEDYCLPDTKKIIEELRIQEKKELLIKRGKEIVRKTISPRGLLELGDLGKKLDGILTEFLCSGTYDLYSKIANGSITLGELNEKLNRENITKKDLQITSIELKGKNKPQIMLDVINQISSAEHNIIRLEQTNISNNKKEEIFILRMVISGMTTEDEKKLTKFFEADKRFSEHTVV